VLETKPDAINTRHLVLAAARERREWQLALRMARELVARSPEPGPADWARVVVGSVVSAWDEVRESASRLGMKLEGEGPIDEAWGLCRVRFAEPSGRSVDLVAQRTGPATARVLQIAGPGRTERFSSVVVVEPRAIDAIDAGAGGARDSGDGREGGRPMLFPELQTVHDGGYKSYALNGVHPGEAAVAALREELRGHGVVVQVVSDPTYQLHPGGSAEPLPGIYAFVAVPSAMTAKEASGLVSTATAATRETLTWLDLAAAAGDEALVAAQREVAQRLGL